MTARASYVAAQTSISRALAQHKLLFRIAAAAANTFAWIFVFRAFYISNQSVAASVAGVAFLYVLAQVIAFILTPVAGASLRRGVRRTMIYGIIAASIGYLSIAALFSITAEYRQLFSFIAYFVVFNGLFRALYWIPYETAQAETGKRKTPTWLQQGLLALMPALAGIMITFVPYGGPLLFVAAGILAAVSALPIFAMTEVHERFEWSYHDTMTALVARARRRQLWLSILDGVQGAGLLLIWPLAAFIVLDWSYLSLGIAISAALCIALILRRIIKRMLTSFNIENSPRVGAAIVFSAWILRLSAGSPLQIIVVDSYYFSGTNQRRLGLDPLSLEQSADGGHYIDEETALKEMGYAIGRSLICLLLATLALVITESVAFVVTLVVVAIAASQSVLLSHRTRRDI